jgi:hypothetical protein
VAESFHLSLFDSVTVEAKFTKRERQLLVRKSEKKGPHHKKEQEKAIIVWKDSRAATAGRHLEDSKNPPEPPRCPSLDGSGTMPHGTARIAILMSG